MTQKIGALVGVRDDVDVLEPCLQNLLRLGFDCVTVVAIDARGPVRDQIDSAGLGDPRIAIRHLDALDPGGKFLTRENALLGDIAQTCNPDWILACDADEFPAVTSGSIHDHVPKEATGPLALPRFNYARRRGDTAESLIAAMAHPETAPVFFRRRQAFKQGQMIDGARWSQHTIGPKILFRPGLTGALGLGLHTATRTDGTQADRQTLHSAAIVHLPFTDFDRFAAKVKNARSQLAALGDLHGGQMSWHWKEWVRSLEAGTLRETFDSESLEPAEFAALQADGGVRILADILADAPADQTDGRPV
ncbi:MAG: hypothetical protein ACWA5A_12300 [Marinibacterium sp.]